MNKFIYFCRQFLIGSLCLFAFICTLIGIFELYTEIFHPEDTALARMEKRALDAEADAAKFENEYEQILEDHQGCTEEIRYLNDKIEYLEYKIYLLTGE